METPTLDSEEVIRVLRENNTELAMKVQHWKMLAGQRENEKLDLMKELNEMRLKLARLRSNGNVQATKLESAIQSGSEKALAHLVRASGEIARTIDLAKTYMREREESAAVSPRWSALGGTPKTERIHRVPPMMIGGQSIQPVVSLSRTLLNTSNPRSAAPSPNQNRNVTERAVPMHMLQDVYIPLTRIDAGELQAQNMEIEAEANNSDDSTEGLELDDSAERSDVEESQRMSDGEFNSPRRLDAVVEDMEPVDETPPRNSSADNPLEGPSWLLDVPSSSSKNVSHTLSNLEPDSTTEVEDVTTPVNAYMRKETPENKACSSRMTCEFSPTVRRRKRTSSPPPVTPRRLSQYSPRPTHRRNSNSGRVLKVMVAKMRLDTMLRDSGGEPAPAKRVATELEFLDAPSPNGATVAGVIVSEETENELDEGASGEPHEMHQEEDHTHYEEERRSEARGRRKARGSEARGSREGRNSRENRSRRQNISSRYESHDSRDSDSGGDLHNEGRTRRNRNKVVSYQEKPLNSRYESHDSRDSDSGGDLHNEGRTRRNRNKVVSYQEKPLNRKMRR